MKPCVCGHSIEEHAESNTGRDRACVGDDCECMHYEADEEYDDAPLEHT